MEILLFCSDSGNVSIYVVVVLSNEYLWKELFVSGLIYKIFRVGASS